MNSPRPADHRGRLAGGLLVGMLLLFLCVGPGCSAKLQPEPQRTGAEQAELTRLQIDLEEATAQLGAPELQSAPNCPAVDRLVRRICELAERICIIAERYPVDRELRSLCEEDRHRCQRAEQRAVQLCPP